MNNENNNLNGNIQPVSTPVSQPGVLPSQPVDNIQVVNANSTTNNGLGTEQPMNTINDQATPKMEPNNIDLTTSTSTEVVPSAPVTPSFVKPVEVKPDESDLLSAVPKPDIMISSPQDTSIDTDILIEDYVYVNYEKISKKPINFSALLFGPSYMLYRKMYLEGGILIVLCYAVFFALLFVNPLLSPLIFVIASILLFISFNKLYINLSKRKIDKIKNRYKVMSVSELKKLCQKKGGTNTAVPIVVSLLVPIVMWTAMMAILPIDSEEILNKVQDSFGNISLPSGGSTPAPSQPSNNKKVTLESITRNEDISIADKINMQYLTVFNPTDKNTGYMYDYVRYTNPDDTSTSCTFNLSMIKDFESSTQLINELASNHNASNTVGTLSTSKGITWNTFKIESDSEIINVAASAKGTDVYLFIYRISKSADQSLANTWNNGVIQSIEFK